MAVKKANREDPDQTASDLSLRCLCVWQATSVRNCISILACCFFRMHLLSLSNFFQN